MITINKRRRTKSDLIKACLLALAMAAAGTSRASEALPGKIVLRVPGLPDNSRTDSPSIAKFHVIEAFLKAHPDIQLQSAEGIRLENVVPEATTIMMVAAGMAPDVIQMNFRSLDSFVAQGIVQPLDEMLTREPGGIDAELARTIPQIRDVIRRPGPEGASHVYALADQPMMIGIFFNRDVFRKAGLPARAPQNWEEMQAFASQIRSRLGPSYTPIALSPGSTSGWNLANFIWSAGGEIVRETAPNQWNATFHGEEAVDAFEFYHRLVNEGLAVRTKDQSARAWVKMGMRFGYIGELIQFDPQTTGFGAVPAGPTGQRGGEINAMLYGVFSGIKDPKVKQAALEYIRFITSDEAERIRVETYVGMGQAGLLSPLALKKFGFTQYLDLVPKGLAEEVDEALRSGHPEPFGKNCNLVYSELSYPVDQMLLDPAIVAASKAGNRDEVRRLIATLLDAAVVKTNERMIGYVSPTEMSHRRLVAFIVATAVFGSFIGLGIYIVRAFSASGATVSRPVASRSVLPWIILAPALLLVLAWHYAPLGRGTLMAFEDYKIFLPSHFVGLDNFANVLFDGTFWNSIRVTLIYAAYTLTLGFAAPVLLAYALHIIPRWTGLYRLLYYLPALLSAAAVFFLWFELFAAKGVLNQFLDMLGIHVGRAWTEDPALAMLACVLPGIWAHAGPGCLIYLAALKTIPLEQFEAAEIDGAGFRQKTLMIVFPGLKSLLIINFIGAVAAAFHGATNILSMTGGGPNRGTEVSSLLIFFEAFTRMRFGTATAMAWIIGSMLIGFTVIQLQRLTRMEFKTAK